MTKPYPAWLERCATLRSLRGDQIEQFLSYSTSVETRAQEYVFREYDDPTHIYLIQEGEWMSELILAEGQRQVGGFSSVGELVGFGTPDAYAYSIKVLVSGRALKIPTADAVAFAESVPSILTNLYKRRDEVMLEMTRRIAVVGKMKAHERICTLLVKIVRMQLNDSDVVLNMTRQDIADFLGLTADTVVRGLKKLEADGIVAIDSTGRDVKLLQPEMVHSLAAGI